MSHSQELYGRIPAQPYGGPARCTPTQQLPAVGSADLAAVTDVRADASADVRADVRAMAPAGS